MSAATPAPVPLRTDFMPELSPAQPSFGRRVEKRLSKTARSCRISKTMDIKISQNPLYASYTSQSTRPAKVSSRDPHETGRTSSISASSSLANSVEGLDLSID